MITFRLKGFQITKKSFGLDEITSEITSEITFLLPPPVVARDLLGKSAPVHDTRLLAFAGS